MHLGIAPMYIWTRESQKFTVAVVTVHEHLNLIPYLDNQPLAVSLPVTLGYVDFIITIFAHH